MQDGLTALDYARKIIVDYSLDSDDDDGPGGGIRILRSDPRVARGM